MRIGYYAILLFLSTLAAAGEISTPDKVRQNPLDREPTPEETLLLEYTNRFRADPPADGQRIVDYVKQNDPWIVEHVDLEMFLKEIKEIKPVSPMVFNLELLASARGHSKYMVLHELTHDQKSGQPGFTGKDFSARGKAARYEGFVNAENVFRDAIGVWGGHIGFVVDYGKDGTGGMQKNRGHRKILSMGSLKEVGIGILPHGEEKWSITEDFGERKVPRRTGGVVYVDLNSNGFYDSGEGVGGVKITASTGGSITTWASGAYTLDLKSVAAVTLTAEYEKKNSSKLEKAGAENIKFDWIMPIELTHAFADRLIETVSKAKPNSPEYEKAVALLFEQTKKLPMDETHRAKIEELTQSYREKLKENFPAR